MEAKMLPKSMKSDVRRPSKKVLKIDAQKITKTIPKGIPKWPQNGAICVPEGRKRDAKIGFYSKMPLGSLLGSILAPFSIDFWSIFDDFLNDFLMILGPCWDHAGTKRTPSAHLEKSKRTSREHTKNTQRTHREHPENTQRTHPENTPREPREHTENT